MAKTPANIVVGAPSTIVISAQGVAEGSGVDVGSTEGGLKFTFTPEFYYKTADQWVGKVGAVKVGEDMTLEFTLAEVSLANLCYALGYPTGAVSGSTLTIGGDDVATERTIYINWNAPSGGTSKLTVHKCVIVGPVELNMVKKDKATAKVTIQVLQDTSQTADQQFFSFVYSSTDTTPPTIAMTTPAEDGSVAAAGTGTVTLTITETGNPIDESTLVYGNADNGTIFVNDIEAPANTSLVAGTIVYNAATKTIIFTPTGAWAAAGNNYSVMITTHVRDLAGNHLANVFYGHFVSA